MQGEVCGAQRRELFADADAIGLEATSCTSGLKGVFPTATGPGKQAQAGRGHRAQAGGHPPTCGVAGGREAGLL